MAEDDKDPEIGNRSAGDRDPKITDGDADGEGRGGRRTFVDRDDDSSAAFIDRDYDDAFPGSDEEPEGSDPGYAAFASELDDPLTDWPYPEAPPEERPETGESSAADGEAENQMSPAPRKAPLQTPKSETSPFDADDLLFSEEDDEIDGSSPDVVDTDQLDDNAVTVNSEEPDSFGTAESGAPDNVPEPPADVELPTAPLSSGSGDISFTAQEDAFDEEDSFDQDFEDEFVDDFLNDLDPPGEVKGKRAGEREESNFDAPDPAIPEMASSSIERADPYSENNMQDIDQESNHDHRPVGLDSGGEGEPAINAEERSLPLGMIAVVAVALVLLGIGGYGVVQQRSEMQTEIRELQARLATTITPQEAEAERETQRQIQLENESLSAELEALTAENSELASQLAGLEEDLQSQAQAQAQKLAEAEAAAKAAAERSARQAAAKAAPTAPAATSSASGSAQPGGPWFVNFGSYADETIAKRWAAKLSVDDGKVIVQSASAAGKTLYRVRVIGLTSQDAAERVATALERQYQLPRLWVGKS